MPTRKASRAGLAGRRGEHVGVGLVDLAGGSGGRARPARCRWTARRRAAWAGRTTRSRPTAASRPICAGPSRAPGRAARRRRRARPRRGGGRARPSTGARVIATAADAAVGPLDRYDSVGTGGQRCPGHDAHRQPGLDARRPTCCPPAMSPTTGSTHRVASLADAHVLEPHGIAVHRGVVERRQRPPTARRPRRGCSRARRAAAGRAARAARCRSRMSVRCWSTDLHAGHLLVVDVGAKPGARSRGRGRRRSAASRTTALR